MPAVNPGSGRHDYRNDELDPAAGAHDYSEGPPIDNDDMQWAHGEDGMDGSSAVAAAVERTDKSNPANRDRASVADVEPWHGKTTTAVDQNSANLARLHGVDPALSQIIDHLHRSPFGGLVPIDLPRLTEANALAIVAEWLRHYNIVIRRQSDDFTRTAHRLAKLEDQRATVRDFFGIGGEDA